MIEIVASYKFKGNVVERNEARIESIDKLVKSIRTLIMRN